MDNFFLNEYFDWKPCPPSSKVNRVNKLLKRLGVWVELTPRKDTGMMTSVEQRMNIFHFSEQVLAYGVPGDFVELGCHEGRTSVILQSVIQEMDPSRRLHVYDSFDGLPDLAEADKGTDFKAGDIKASRQKLISNFERYKLPLPEIHEGWFDKTLAVFTPEAISLAHLDGDFYDSIMVSLEYVYPKLSKGAICIIDDYGDDTIPGAKIAADEFLEDKPESVSNLYSNGWPHGYFRKQ